MQHHKSVEKFIKKVGEDCKKFGVRCRLENDTHIAYGDELGLVKVNGYFSDGEGEDEGPELAVAIGKPIEDWLPILVHEYNHMHQWHEKIPGWVDAKINGEEPYNIIDAWIGRQIEPTNEVLDTAIHMCMWLEADCEERSAKCIEEYKLPIDVDTYTQKANAYVKFYRIIRQERKWYRPGFEPYNIERVWKAMPTNFTYIMNALTPEEENLLMLCI